MHCSACKQKIEDDTIFCRFCGTEVATRQASQAHAVSPADSTIPVPDSPPPVALPTPPPGGAPFPPLQSSGQLPTPPPSQWPSTPFPSPEPQWPTNTFPPPVPLPAPPKPVILPASPNATQRLLIRLFQPTLASSAWFGIALGGLLAALLSVITFLLLFPLFHSLVQPPASGIVPDPYEYLVLNVVGLNNGFREGLQLLLAALGIGTHQTYPSVASGVSVSTYVESATLPLNGLLVLPAIFLILGGYIAACTDFQQRPANILLRGTSIAVPYTLVLFLLSLQVNGNIPIQGQGGGPGSAFIENATLTMDMAALWGFGLLWGVLFGLLGASLKLGQGCWRQKFYAWLFHIRSTQLAGLLMGGLVATLFGFFLALLAVASLVAYTAFSLPLLTLHCYNGAWQNIMLWGLTLAPMFAVILLALACGAPLTLHNEFAGSTTASCFYTTIPNSSSLGLFTGTSHPQPWMWLMILIPALALFLGGRVSVAISRVRGNGPAAVQGALIALPFALLMMGLTALAVTSYTSSDTYNTSSQSLPANVSALQSLGVGLGDALLWCLLCGALFGALGGIYQQSSFKYSAQRILHALAAPFLIIAAPCFFLLDRLTAHPRCQSRSRARLLLYSALLLAFLLTIVAVIAGLLLISMNRVVSAEANQHYRDILASLLIALPGLFLLGSAAAAFATAVPPLPSNIPFTPAAPFIPTPVPAPTPALYQPSHQPVTSDISLHSKEREALAPRGAFLNAYGYEAAPLPQLAEEKTIRAHPPTERSSEHVSEEQTTTIQPEKDLEQPQDRPPADIPSSEEQTLVASVSEEETPPAEQSSKPASQEGAE